jgi:hypothetical protein
MYFRNKNIIVKWHTKIYKYLKIFLYFNLWWQWFDDDVQHANVHTFL